MNTPIKNLPLEKVINAVNESKSYPELLKKLNLENILKYRTYISRYIKKNNISTEHFITIKNHNESKFRYDKDNLIFLVKNHKTFKDVLLELNLLPITSNYNNLKRYLKKYNIDYSHIINSNKLKYDKNTISSIVKKSKSLNEVLLNLGLRAAGGNYKTILKYIKMYDINTSHFNQKSKEIQNKKELNSILVSESSYSRKELKKRLYSEGLKKRKCELCGQDENWHGKKMSLILDHINGVWNDNRIENLRIVCPNCNATLDTHGGKNIKKKIKVDKRMLNRKVERPSYEQLKTEIKKLGYVGTGKKYGVSDNAIRKWEIFYRKFQP